MVSTAGLPMPFVLGADVGPLGQSTSGSHRPGVSCPGVCDVLTAVTLPMQGLASVLYHFYHAHVLPNCKLDQIFQSNSKYRAGEAGRDSALCWVNIGFFHSLWL